MIRKIFMVVITNYLLLFVSAQGYDHRKTFDPNFYPQTGNDYRSASGAPGPKYWQNRADYKINGTLNTDQHKVSGEVEIRYSNNSPDNLTRIFIRKVHAGLLLQRKPVAVMQMLRLPKAMLLSQLQLTWMAKKLQCKILSLTPVCKFGCSSL